MEKWEEKFHELEKRLSYMELDGHKRLSTLEQTAARLSEVAAVRAEQLNNLSNQILTFEQHLTRMETSMLNELKISQEIMKSMLNHDMNLEQIKEQFRMEQEKKEREWLQQQQQMEAELLNQQKEFELQNKKDRAEFKRNLYIKIGAIGVPVLTALAAAFSKLIEKF